jgi:hypothetical protein
LIEIRLQKLIGGALTGNMLLLQISVELLFTRHVFAHKTDQAITSDLVLSDKSSMSDTTSKWSGARQRTLAAEPHR